MLTRFRIIVSVDDNNGIGKNGTIPWINKEDMEHFNRVTIGDGKNAIIMGRKTYQSLGGTLPKRENIVITSQIIQGTRTYASLLDALRQCTQYRKVYIIGGKRVFEEAIVKFLYLCDKIIISHISGNYNCDTFFPRHLINETYVDVLRQYNKGFTLEIMHITYTHPEEQYINLLVNILVKGEQRLDRTKVGIRSIFCPRMVFDLREGFPLITTKRTWFEGIKKELLFFISGKTDTKILESQGVNIWKANTSHEYLQKYNLPWREGDIGPGYSFQWRHSGAKYTGCDSDYTGEGVDQLNNLITGIKNDPFGRRHIISSWDVANIHLMALPPCHCFVQFYVGCENENPKYLDCCLYQRSADMFLGVPFNIASYALLLCIIADITDLIPRKFIHDLGDAHIYLNHINQIKEQIARTPYPFPTIRFNRKLTNIDDIKLDDIIIDDYISHTKLTADMAV